MAVDKNAVNVMLVICLMKSIMMKDQALLLEASSVGITVVAMAEAKGCRIL